MAYIERGGKNEWLDWDARNQYMDDLENEKNLIIRVIRAGMDTEADVDRLEFIIDELERCQRIHRAETDILYFGMEYFSEDANPGNQDNLIPEGVHVGNAAQFHKQLCDILEDVSEGHQRRHVAWACPRSHAKTAWLSQIFLVHQLVFRKKRYIVLFSETTDVAGDFIGWGRYQLKLNEKLRNDYGGLLHPRATQNDLDNKYEFITTSNAKVEAKGLGTQTRGLRHGSTRPDLFILDDLESKESTNTPELIEKSKAWFREDMLPAMDKQKGLCVYLGTILCYDSLLDYVIRERKDFESRKFKAVTEWADRQDLWNEWRDIYREDEKDAAERARLFYEDNYDEMLEGAEILWPGYWDYYDFMVLLEENGIKAFNQEYLNEPTDEERQIFKPEYFHFIPEGDITKKSIQYYAGVDFAMGKEKGDFSVIATIAKNTETGNMYVVDLFVERCHPDRLLTEIVKRAFKYQYEGIGVEAQQAQEWFADKLTETLQDKGYPGHTRVKQIKQRTRKALRIEALLPEIQSGKLRFSNAVKRYMDYFYMYPMVKHDDVPDAIQMAFSTADIGEAVVRTAKTAQQRWNRPDRNKRLPNGRVFRR